jgi:hypothetical protein
LGTETKKEKSAAEILIGMKIPADETIVWFFAFILSMK